MRWANKFTLLHWAARAGRTSLCAFFLNSGADPCAKDDFGRSPLMYALHKHRREVVLLFEDWAEAGDEEVRARWNAHVVEERIIPFPEEEVVKATGGEGSTFEGGVVPAVA